MAKTPARTPAKTATRKTLARKSARAPRREAEHGALARLFVTSGAYAGRGGTQPAGPSAAGCGARPVATEQLEICRSGSPLLFFCFIEREHTSAARACRNESEKGSLNNLALGRWGDRPQAISVARPARDVVTAMAVGGSAISVKNPGTSAVFSDPSSLRILGTTNSVDKARMPRKVEHTVYVHIFYICTYKGQIAKPLWKAAPDPRGS